MGVGTAVVGDIGDNHSLGVDSHHNHHNLSRSLLLRIVDRLAAHNTQQAAVAVVAFVVAVALFEAWL